MNGIRLYGCSIFQFKFLSDQIGCCLLMCQIVIIYKSNGTYALSAISFSSSNLLKEQETAAYK